jgi:hypothetical protein
MAAFYANENFPLPTVLTLRSLGHDVLTIQETGRGGAAVPDEEVLALAAAERRILLTLNRKHFIRLHEQQRGPRWYRGLNLRPGFCGSGPADP